MSISTINKSIFNSMFIIIGFFFFNSSFAQTEFFNSKIEFSDTQLSNFYSSFSIDSSQVYFIANDYNIYAYDKKTGTLKWKQYLANKTNTSPKVFQNSILVTKHLEENLNRTIQLNAKTGNTIQTLKIDALETNPFFKNSILYCAAIAPEIGGAILAYDLKNNTIVWQKFIAHGSSSQPYFFDNKIVANAEGDNWFEIDYNGKLIDTACANKANIYAEDIKCVKNYRFLTHDKKEITESFLQKNINYTIDLIFEYQENNTFILGNETVLILGNKKKIQSKIELAELLPDILADQNSFRKIVKIEKNTIWFFYENNMVEYDFKMNKTLKTIDFSKWNPHQVILDNDILWLISSSDGQLYGIKIN